MNPLRDFVASIFAKFEKEEMLQICLRGLSKWFGLLTGDIIKGNISPSFSNVQPLVFHIETYIVVQHLVRNVNYFTPI